MSKLSLTRLSVAAGLVFLGASNAFAASTCPETNDPSADYKCVFIDVNTNKYGSGTTTTGFYSMGYTDTLATSIYDTRPTGGNLVGATVIDTNRTSVLNSYGFIGSGNRTALAGNTVFFTDTASAGQKNIDQLNPSNPATSLTDTQGLNFSGVPALLVPAGYQLTYDYLLNGVLGASGAAFSSGDFAVYYTNLATNATEQVLRVNIDTSQLTPANLFLFGTISFDFDNDPLTSECTSVLCQGFWNFQTGSQAFYALAGQGVQISFRLDTNVTPPIPEPEQLFASSTLQGVLARQTELDGSVIFNQVPEPGTLALVGLTLLGVASRSTRRARRS